MRKHLDQSNFGMEVFIKLTITINPPFGGSQAASHITSVRSKEYEHTFVCLLPAAFFFYTVQKSSYGIMPLRFRVGLPKPTGMPIV